MQSGLNIAVTIKMSISFFNKIPVYTEDSWIKKIASKCLYETPSSIVSLMFNSTPTSLCNKSIDKFSSISFLFQRSSVLPCCANLGCYMLAVYVMKEYM